MLSACYPEKFASKEAQNSASVAAILNKSSAARPLGLTSFRSREFVPASVFVLEVMAELQPYCFEPECVPNAEESESESENESESESENEEVSDRLGGTF